jgi:cell division protein FtsB
MMNDWLQHTLDRSRWRPQRQVIALATLGLFVLIIIGALYLSQSAASSSLGRQLEDMLAERDELQQQNEQLRGEIALLQSMPRLQGRAGELGFVPAEEDDIRYLVIDGYDPHPNAAVIEIEAEPTPLPDYDETFVGWLQQQWDTFLAQVEAFTQRDETAGDS